MPALGTRQGYMSEENYSTGYSTAPGFLGITAQPSLDRHEDKGETERDMGHDDGRESELYPQSGEKHEQADAHHDFRHDHRHATKRLQRAGEGIPLAMKEPGTVTRSSSA